jgi:hypothetical protein
MDKVRKPNISESYTQSSESYSNYKRSTFAGDRVVVESQNQFYSVHVTTTVLLFVTFFILLFHVGFYYVVFCLMNELASYDKYNSYRGFPNLQFPIILLCSQSPISRYIIMYIFILTANGFSPGGSGITIRHNTQTTHITQNNTTIKRNTVHKNTHTMNTLHRMKIQQLQLQYTQ